ncbi:MAG: hypothetical protein Q9217_001874 [Psora testacea]
MAALVGEDVGAGLELPVLDPALDSLSVEVVARTEDVADDLNDDKVALLMVAFLLIGMPVPLATPLAPVMTVAVGWADAVAVTLAFEAEGKPDDPTMTPLVELEDETTAEEGTDEAAAEDEEPPVREKSVVVRIGE